MWPSKVYRLYELPSYSHYGEWGNLDGAKNAACLIPLDDYIIVEVKEDVVYSTVKDDDYNENIHG